MVYSRMDTPRVLAPKSVEFFSIEGERLGDKTSLEQTLHSITGIPTQALRGRDLSEFSIDERMSWAERRETTREEDAVYSLLGIFDIHMPLIYGEGQKKALKRLRKEIRESQMDESSSSPPARHKKRLKQSHMGNEGVHESKGSIECSKCLFLPVASDRCEYGAD
jgi:hypothetical protein